MPRLGPPDIGGKRIHLRVKTACLPGIGMGYVVQLFHWPWFWDTIGEFTTEEGALKLMRSYPYDVRETRYHRARGVIATQTDFV